MNLSAVGCERAVISRQTSTKRFVVRSSDSRQATGTVSSPGLAGPADVEPVSVLSSQPRSRHQRYDKEIMIRQSDEHLAFSSTSTINHGRPSYLAMT